MGLIRVLGHGEDSHTRSSAAQALGRIGDPRAVEPLLAGLIDGDLYFGTAAEALGKIGDKRAVALLIGALQDGHAHVRKAAAAALGDIGDERAVGPLITTLEDEHGDVRHAAVLALDRMGWKPDRGEAGAWYWITRGGWEETSGLGLPAVDPLIAILRDRDRGLQKHAALALGKIGDPRAVAPLIVALMDADGDVPLAAAEALGRIGDVRAIGPLITALKDESSAWYAVEALDKLAWEPDLGEAGAWYWVAKREWDKACALGSPAVEPLIAALKGGDEDVREDAVLALGEIGDVRAVGPLIAVLEDVEDEHRDVREAAVLALGEIGDVLAVGPLIAIAARRNDLLCSAATLALGEIGASAVEPLSAALRDEHPDVRRAAATALGGIGNARAVDLLIAALKDRHPDVNKAAAKALDGLGWKPDQGEIGAWYWIARGDWETASGLGPSAVDPLIAVLEDRDRGGRQRAAEALGRIGDVRAIGPLGAILSDSGSGPLRWAAAAALGEVGVSAVAPLTAALEDESIAWHAVEALDKLGWEPDRGEAGAWYWVRKREWENACALGSPAVEPLIAALMQTARDVRVAAAQVLVRLYSSGSLSPQHEERILKQRSVINSEHLDESHEDHTDHEGCYTGHSDGQYQRHSDHGIGVDFPL